MIELVLGILIGLLVNPFRSETQEVLKRFSKKLPHKMASFEGYSEEESNFAESLKSELPKKIL